MWTQYSSPKEKKETQASRCTQAEQDDFAMEKKQQDERRRRSRGWAGGEQEPVTPEAQPALFLMRTSAPELSLGGRS